MSGQPPLGQARDIRALVEQGAPRALTLLERRDRLAQGSSGGNAPVRASQAGRRLLHAWSTQAPFDRTDLFAKRLALDGLHGLDEATLLTLVDPEANATASAGDTPWVSTWLSAFEAAGSLSNPTMPLRDIVGNDYALFQPLEPLFAHFIERARVELETITSHCAHGLFDQQCIVAALAAQLRPLILPKIIRTWVLELNVARVAGELDGESPPARFQHFLLRLSEPGTMATVLSEYSVLARVLVETLERWLAHSAELLRHLAQDWDALNVVFPMLRKAGPLVRIESGLGDLHRGGRSVTMFAWSSGFRLVYKPRSLAVDLHFQALLKWANAHGFSLPLRTLAIVDRGDHGWCEWVERESTRSRTSVEAFYRRLGGQLALLYALEGADFHAENIIAAGSHPVLIDLEGLFHPRFDSSAPDDTGAHRLTMHSVLRVGLLPRRMWSQPDAAGLDLSGLGAKNAQRSPVELPSWADQGTDLMRLAPARGHIQLSLGHLPQIDNEAVDAAEFRSDVGAGFDEMYRVMLAHRTALGEFVERTFAHDPVRCIFRSTHQYSKILFDSYHPDALRDAIERDRVLDMLWVDVERAPRLEQVLLAERADLTVGDIPLFVTTPSSRDTCTSRGRTISDVFESCALHEVGERIARLDENDLHRQRWMIDASFASMVLSDGGPGRARLTEPLTPSEPTRERLVEQARAIGERLHRLALEDEEGASWIGIEPRSSQEWQVGPVGIDLYAGLSGIVLFLAYLGATLDEVRFTSLAARAFSSLRTQLARQPQSWRRRGAGAFTGVAGYVYLLSHLSSLWQSRETLRDAEHMVPTLVELIDADTTFDVMGGTAGCIAALLSLHAVAPGSAALAAAIRGGHRLVACARPQAAGVGWQGLGPEHAPLTGFSHGNAGIAWALLRLFEVTGQMCFLDTALAGLEYERRLFSSSHDNWPDLRVCASPETGFAAQVAWCHGAPGIVLSRLDTLAAADEPRTRAEIAAGLRTTIACGLGSNHSLCHGVMGNLETLSNAGERLNDATILGEATRLAGLTLASIEAHGLVTGVPNGTETPGLMVGTAGIGYGLLRLAFAERVPSVLLLQPPRNGVQRERIE